eukprot:3684414-Rhodomonas_salina.2
MSCGSVFVFHKESKTVFKDDTICVMRDPGLSTQTCQFQMRTARRLWFCFLDSAASCYAMPGTDIACPGPVLRWLGGVKDGQVDPLSAYVLATRCPVPAWTSQRTCGVSPGLQSCIGRYGAGHALIHGISVIFFMCLGVP